MQQDSEFKYTTWKSKIGFILATSGAAIGLGNIQRFPYIAAQNGGAAFLLLYLGCVLALGLPLMLVEFAIGRAAGSNPISAMLFLGGGRKRWGFVGALGVLTAFSILTYYVAAGGWTLGYAISCFQGRYPSLDEFASSPTQVISYTLVMLVITTLVVSRGLNKGIEVFSKIAMPVLVCLLLILVFRSLTLEGAWQGVTYYLLPDFSKITPQAMIAALSQAFFSLCIGEAVLITYGSFAPKKENLPLSVLYICSFDTLVAFLAGLIIFPALFSSGGSTQQGVSLIYNVLPTIFSQMSFGPLIGGGFFLMLAFAALTTCVALLEIPAHCLSDFFGWPKKRVIWVLSFVAFLGSVPAALSQGSSKWLSQLKVFSINATGYYEIMDYAWGGVAMVISGLLTTVFCSWVWGSNQASKELIIGSPSFRLIAPIWSFHIKWIAPILILVILASLFLS